MVDIVGFSFVFASSILAMINSPILAMCPVYFKSKCKSNSRVYYSCLAQIDMNSFYSCDDTPIYLKSEYKSYLQYFTFKVRHINKYLPLIAKEILYLDKKERYYT